MVVINTHEADADKANEVDRRHVTVANLIAQLQQLPGDAEIVIKNLNTGKYGSLNFQTLSQEA